MKKSNTLLINFLLLTIVNTIYSEKLLGVTLEVKPYVTIKDNKFNGYCIDILNEISRIAGFNYSLYLSPDKKHGLITPYGRITGMIGEVYNRAADFAISDLTVTEELSRYVEFTEPFMKFGLSALIHKSNVGDIQSFKDLSKQEYIKYGTYKNGKTIKLFYESVDKTVSKMYFFMMRHKSNLMSNISEAINLVKNSKYAFIQESPANEFIAANDCDLTVIHDKMDNFKREYAIALPMYSHNVKKFNKAIEQLKNSGLLDQLKQKYWAVVCNHSETFKSNIIMLFIVISVNTLFMHK